MTLADGRNIVLIAWTIGGIILALLPGVGLFFAIKGLRILKRKILPYAHQTRFYFYRVERATERASYTVVRPIVATAGAAARVKFYWHHITSFVRHQED